MALDIVVTNDQAEARRLCTDGWCPVECAFGDTSIIDDLRMDHHGRMSGEESVAIRACRDHFGARVDDPRFVIAGVADADATFAVAALAGLVPRSPEAHGFDIIRLAETIAVLDVDPIGRDVLLMPHGDVLATWNALFGGGRDRLAALAGVHGWRVLAGAPTPRLKPFISAAIEATRARRTAAANELTRGRRVGRVLVLEGTEAPGFDVWYARRGDGSPDSPSSWENPVVVAVSVDGQVTVACPNEAVARELFGPSGLIGVFPVLKPEGWGGRPAIGGGPRGVRLNRSQIDTAAALIDAARL